MTAVREGDLIGQLKLPDVGEAVLLKVVTLSEGQAMPTAVQVNGSKITCKVAAIIECPDLAPAVLELKFD